MNNDYEIKNRFINTDQKSKKKNIIPILIIVLLILVAAFLVYELKFNKKNSGNHSDRYSEYDPNFPIESQINENQKENKENDSNDNNASNDNDKDGIGGITENIISNNNSNNKTSNKTSNTDVSNKTSNTTNEKDNVNPTISNFKVIKTTDTTLTVSGTFSDNVTSNSKLTVRYSIDNGKTWQTGSTFSKLKQNWNYEILVQITDEAGNSSRKSISAKTNRSPVRENVTGVYQNGSTKLYVYQLNSNEIVYKINNQNWQYSEISSILLVEKKFSNGFLFDYSTLTYNNKIYTYSSNSTILNTSSIFNEVYKQKFKVSTNAVFNSGSVCNGAYKKSDNKATLYFMGYNNTCSLYVDKGSEKGWINYGVIKVEKDHISFGYGSQAGTFFRTDCTISANRMTVTNPANPLDKDDLANKTAGTYYLSKKLTIEDAIELMLRGKI